MSDHEHAHADHGARSEPDVVPSGSIVAVGVGALVIFLLASLAATTYLRGQERQHPLPPAPPELGRSKIGMVEQQLFELADRGARDHARRVQRLQSYGWVDRSQGIAHIPIGEAMDLVLHGVRPSGPPSAAPAPTSGQAPGGQP